MLAPNLAVTVKVVVAATGGVVIVNVVLVAPAGIVTDAGNCKVELVLERVTVTALGSGCEMVTVPVVGEPPKTDVGDTVKDDKPTGVPSTTTIRPSVRVAVKVIWPLLFQPLKK